jgi:hypothetical protein
MSGKEIFEIAQLVDREVDRLVAFVDEDLAPGRSILEKGVILLGYVVGAAEEYPELREVTYAMLESSIARLRELDREELERN